MMQRIFDVENEKDMADLWNILPDDVEKIEIEEANGYNKFCFKKVGACEHSISSLNLIAINWHDKTEITRPVNYEDMIGCVVYFYNEPEYKSLGIFKREIDGRTFVDELGGFWDYIEPVKKSELKFYGEQDDR